MGPILAFDTSAAHCAAALVSGEQCLTHIEPMPKGQAERLLPLLEEILAEAGLLWADLVALGVGTGPGNFTGTRIGVAAARGLALGLGIPAVGVTSFEALALGQDCAVVQDARRGMIHAQGFVGGQPVAPPVMIEAEGTLPFPAGPALVGDMAATLGPAHGVKVAEPVYPLPEAIARIAATRFASTTERPAPLYLRPADAAPPREAPVPILPG